MSRVPRIRFKGFKEDWEQRKLGEYLIQYTEVTIINDQYPVLTSSRKGIFFQKDYYDGNQIASENNIGYNIVPYGYFTYRHMSDDEIFYFNINNIIDNGIVSTLYPVFTTNNRLDSKFLQYELNFGKEFRKYSVLQKQGGSRTYMYFNKLRDLKLTITTSLKEQECIRNLICSIDHLITLHQSKSFEYIFKAIVNCTLYWEQRKLGDIFIYLRNNTLSREELNDEDGFAQSIHYGDVLIKYGECLNVSKGLLPYIDNKNIVNKFKKFYIQNGDVIIADTAEDETVGKCIEISGIVDHNIISGLHTIPLRPVNKFAYGYLGFYLNSNSYHNQLKPLMQGIKVRSISKNLLKTTTLNYPSNTQEQKIIGIYFDALNHLITLHQLEPYKLIFKAIAYRIIDYAKSKPPRCIK